MRIIGMFAAEERERGTENTFKEIMKENCTHVGNFQNTDIQGAGSDSPH